MLLMKLLEAFGTLLCVKVKKKDLDPCLMVDGAMKSYLSREKLKPFN
jgi:hypothetical protein